MTSPSGPPAGQSAGTLTVGVNGTAASDAAVRYAVTQARRTGAGVRLVHALPDYFPASRPFAGTVSDLAPTGRALLHAAGDLAREVWPDVALETTLVAGPWVKAMLHAAEGSSAIVLGWDQRPVVQRLATGSMVAGIAARSPVPVIAVGSAMTATEHGRVTVGVKEPAASHALLRSALRLAAERGCELHVVHCWMMPPGYEGLLAGATARAEVTRSASEQLDVMLHGVGDQLAALGLGASVTVAVTEGHPARVLQEASETSDLLLLARRRHVLPGGHIGGTARALLQHSSCPVVILPAPDEPTHRGGAHAGTGAHVDAVAAEVTAPRD